MKAAIAYAYLLLLGLTGFAQSHFTAHDSIVLARLPVLRPPETYFRASLPAIVDNTVYPYYIGVIEQQDNSCNQVAAITTVFTYEIDRIRNLPANIAEYQYPSHYAYNFMNGGYGYHGASYYHSYEIAKTNGMPNVADYGGIAAGGPSRWLTGYENYWRGMHNRISEMYQIDVGTAEGLEVLKSWLFDHLEGSAAGGLACFIANTPWNTKLLPPGTPEAGKHVITHWGGQPTHGMPILGYNDSIRYDYNGDGQYTNDLDINGDGQVDMRDWEMGGLRFSDTYLGGIGFADSGYCYMMYKTLAEDVSEGGIWNHAVHVIDVQESYEPRITFRIVISHTQRQRIKVMAGISGNPARETPEHTLGFPIFNFQGGNQYMQGGNSLEENKTIEFGLDVTPLLSYARPGEEATFYLIIQENDPQGSAEGALLHFSLIDYTDGMTEVVHSGTPVGLVNDGLTTLALNHVHNVNTVNITDQALTPGTVNEWYVHQFHATGGSLPYEWHLVKMYSEDYGSGFPLINDQLLITDDTLHGKVMQKLGFSFPFYDRSYDSVYLTTDGLALFSDIDSPWPYLYDYELYLRCNELIAPFLHRFLYIKPGNPDGIWYAGDESHASFRWHLTSSSPAAEGVEFGMTLYPSGIIEFHYPLPPLSPQIPFIKGISRGDQVNYQVIDQNPFSNRAEAQTIILSPPEFPQELSFTKNGLLYGNPLHHYDSVMITVMVKDAKKISHTVSLPFDTGPDGIPEVPGNNHLQVFQNQPNPFAASTSISYDPGLPGRIIIKIMTLQGKPILTEQIHHEQPGLSQFVWNGSDSEGKRCTPGIYIYSISDQRGNMTSRKMVLAP